MARLPRYVIPGQPQHIIQRGNNREAIFGADADYRFFRGALVEAATRQVLAIHDDGLTPHPEYLKLERNPPERERAYRQLFQTAIAPADLADIRDCSHKGWVLGSERFKEHIESLAKRRATSKELGRPRKENKRV